MGVDLDAVLFWGAIKLTVDLDATPDWEEGVAKSGCEVVFCGDDLHLAVTDSLTRQRMWGCSSPESLEVRPEWAERLAAGARTLGWTPPPEAARWYLAAHIY